MSNKESGSWENRASFTFPGTTCRNMETNCFLCVFFLTFSGSLQHQSYRAPGSGWAQCPYTSQANSRDNQVSQADGGGLLHPSVDRCHLVLDCVCDPVCQQYCVPGQCKWPSWASLGYKEKQSLSEAISRHSAKLKLFYRLSGRDECEDIRNSPSCETSDTSFSDDISVILKCRQNT